MPLDPDLQEHFESELAAHPAIPPEVARNLINIESGGTNNPATAVSPKGAIGPMQLTRGTAAGLGVDPTDPKQNISGGLQYLEDNIKKFGVAGGVAAYQAGPRAVRNNLDKGGDGIPGTTDGINTTRQYVTKALKGTSFDPSLQKTDTAENAAAPPYRGSDTGTPAAPPAPGGGGEYANDAVGGLGDAPAPTADTSGNSFIGDSIKNMAGAAAELPQGVGQAAQYVGRTLGLPSVEGFGSWLKTMTDHDSDFWYNQMSPENKQAADDPIITQDWHLGPTPVKSLILQAERMAPAMAVAGGATGVALKGLEAVGAFGNLVRVFSAVAPNAPRAAIESAATKVLTGAAGAPAIGAVFGATSAADLQARVEKKPLEELDGDPSYEQAFAATDPNLPDQRRGELARTRVAEAAADYALPRDAGMFAAATLATGGGPLAKLHVPDGAGVLRRVLQGAGVDAAFLAPQMGAQTAIENLATKKYVDPNQDVTQGVASAAAGGALFGAAMGAGKGVMPGKPAKPVEFPGSDTSPKADSGSTESQPAQPESTSDESGRPPPGGQPPPPGAAVTEFAAAKQARDDAVASNDRGAIDAAKARMDAARTGLMSSTIDGDVGAATGQPFGSRQQAMFALKRTQGGALTETHEPAELADGAWILRKKSGESEPESPQSDTTAKPVAETPESQPTLPPAEEVPPAGEQAATSPAKPYVGGVVDRESGEIVPPTITPPHVPDEGDMAKLHAQANADLAAQKVYGKEPTTGELKDVNDKLDEAARHVAPQTEAQAEKPATKENVVAGNAALDHRKLGPFDVSLENRAGTTRSDLKNTPPKWQTEMKADYGYAKGTVGHDKDHLDFYIKPGTPDDYKGPVHVVDQLKPDGSFDEHKVMVGWQNTAAARKAYMAHYEKGWKGMGAITPSTLDEVKGWADAGGAQKGKFADWKGVAKKGADAAAAAAAAANQKNQQNQQNETVVGKRLVMHLKSLGGVDIREASDTVGETGMKARRLLPGLFRNTSRGESGNFIKVGRSLSTLVHDGELNDYLPPDMRPGSERYDEDESVEHVRDLINRDLASKDVGPHEQMMRRELEAQAIAHSGFDDLRSQTRDVVSDLLAHGADDDYLGEMSDEEINKWLAEGQEPAGSITPRAAREGGGSGEETTPADDSEAKGEKDEGGGNPTVSEPSSEYEAAYTAANAAAAKFREVTDQYRARKIGDAEYLAARKEYDAANATFDDAYAKEEARAPDAEPTEPKPEQGALFEPKGEYNDAVAEPKEGDDGRSEAAEPAGGGSGGRPESVQDAASGHEQPDAGRGADTIRTGMQGPGITERGLGIARTFTREKATALVGQRIRGERDFADLAQIYRDPQVETLRLQFVDDDGNIVHGTGVSSRQAGQSKAFPVEAGHYGFEWVKQQMLDHGATGYWMLHNHPSGEPRPSPQDVELTKAFADNVPGFNGHVVINHDKYGVVAPNGVKSVLPLIPKTNADQLLTPAIPHPVLGRNIDSYAAMADVGHDLKNPGYITLIGHGNNGVRAISDFAPQNLASARAAMNALERFSRKTGSDAVFVYGRPEDLEKIAGGNPDMLVKYGHARDVMDTSGKSTHARLSLTDPSFDPNVRRPSKLGESVAEDALAYGDEPERPEGGPQGAITGFDRAKDAAKEIFDAAVHRDGTLPFWRRGVQSPFDKANALNKDGSYKNPGYKRVFDAVQAKLRDTAMFQMDAADKAPDILPRLENLGDVFKRGPSSDDMKAAFADAMRGTITAKRVYSDEEMRANGRSERAIGYYHQIRDAIDQSLDDRTASTAALVSRDAGIPKSVIDAARADPANAKEIYSKAFKPLMDEAERRLNDARDYKKRTLDQEMADSHAKIAELDPVAKAKESADINRRIEGMGLVMQRDVDSAMTRMDNLGAVYGAVLKDFGRAATLKKEGYVPAMRFGEHGVTAFDTATGETKHFSRHETQLAANREAARLHAEHPEYAITQGKMAHDASDPYEGLTPEAVKMFTRALSDGGNMDELHQQLFQDYLKLATSERSPLKRMIYRKGVPGWSEDAHQVLSSFTSSNARESSRNYHALEMKEALANIDKTEHGDVYTDASKLIQYVEEGGAENNTMRSLMFVNFLGGSVVSALNYATQVPLMTHPYLSQFGGMAKAAKAIGYGFKIAAGAKREDTLNGAMNRATKEGLLKPLEQHMMYAETAGRSGVINSLPYRKFARLWGGMFSAVEQYNRRATFAAAWGMAKNMTPGELRDAKSKDAYDFAKNAVDQTQLVYNKGNRPNWFRGPVGATVGTFKSFTIGYAELINRLPAPQKALALSLLVAGAGVQGLPFAQDLEDLIDIVGQHLGWNTNSKEWLRQKSASILGKTAGDMFMHGATHFPGSPIDMSNRIGLGHMIPGLSALKPSGGDLNQRLSDAMDVIGPAGQLVKEGLAVSPQVAQGQFGALGSALAPKALRNVVQGAESAKKGYTTSASGYKVTDVSPAESAAQALGFVPSAVGKANTSDFEAKQDIQMANNTKSAIQNKIAQARVDGDTDAEAAARKQMADWNEKNPDSQIFISGAQVNAMVRAMRLDREQRITKSAPKPMRSEVREDLAQQ